MWSEQPFETLLQSRLASLAASKGAELMADYVSARRYVVEEVVEHIGTAEPNLTDHGARHLEDVMRRVNDLIGYNPNYFSPPELYVLAISILFHDVGNLHGRKEHQQKIASIYGAVRGDASRFRNERTAVLTIAGAHTGSAKDGTHNTLASVGDLSFGGATIRGRELAAVLRLADELAEGPHRTSAYLASAGFYAAENLVYHAYANAVDYAIDNQAQGRIAITLNMNVHQEQGVLYASSGVTLESLLKLSYYRIVKLDQERRYCKHFSPILRNLSETYAWLMFYSKHQPLDVGLEPVILNDLVIPGDHMKEIDKVNQSYEVTGLISRISSLCSEA